MAREKSERPEKKKKKPVFKKIVGNVKPSEVAEMRKPGKPPYEHG